MVLIDKKEIWNSKVSHKESSKNVSQRLSERSKTCVLKNVLFNSMWEHNWTLSQRDHRVTFFLFQFPTDIS